MTITAGKGAALRQGQRAGLVAAAATATVSSIERSGGVARCLLAVAAVMKRDNDKRGEGG